MATGTAERGPQSTPPAKTSEGRWLQYDQFIDSQLRKARGQVKGVELAGALMALAAGGLLFFLLVSVVDHWLVSGGLGFWGRLACLAVFLVGAGWFIARRLGPLLLRRINPIYAAETIEKSKPSLKNALINFLFLRSQPAGVPQVIYRAVEEQAASSLQRTPVEATVDRTRVIQIGYVLLAIVALFAAYKVFSPKDPLETVQRVVMPWADIQAPTRVAILDVMPGDITGYLGEAVEISAEVRGIGADESVKVLYTTADQGTVDQPVVMYRAATAFRHTAKIPSGEGGLQQDLEYRIEAGDAVSPIYHLKAAAAPMIAVESIDYEFPAYMERAKSHIENTGDIQAYEGTTVTIHGRANQPLKSAQLVLDGDGRHQALLPMQIDGRIVTAKFTLKLDEKDHAPEFSRYQLRPDGRAKPEPAQYKIEVFADLPPEIKFLSPKEDELTVPVNGSVQLELRAHDPDFALAEVTLSAQRDETSIIDKKLLAQRHPGPLLSKFPFQPTKLGLKEGDTVSYWATAKDNRTPTANEARTPHRLVRIVKAEPRRIDPEPANQAKENPDPNPNPNEDGSKPKDDQHPDHSPKDPNNNPSPDAQNPNSPDKNPDNKQDNRQDDSHRDNRPKEQSNEGNPPQDNKADQSKQDGGEKGPKSSGGKGNDKNQKADGSDSGGEGKQDAAKGGDSSHGGSSNGNSNGNAAKGSQPNEKPSGDQSGNPSSGDPSSGSPSNGKQSGDPSSGKPSAGDQPKNSQPSGQGTKGQSQPDGAQSGKPDEGGPSGNQQSPADKSSVAKTADAIRQALAKQDQQAGGNAGTQSDKQSGQSAADGQSKNGGGTGDNAADGSSQKPSSNPQGSNGPAPNGKPGTGGDKGSEKQSGQKADFPQPGANQQSGDKHSGDNQSGEKQPGNKQSGEKQPGNNQGGDKRPGDNQSGSKQSGEKQSGEKQTGEKQSSPPNPGGQQSPSKAAGNEGNREQHPSGDQSKAGSKPETAGQPNPDGQPQPPKGSQPDGQPQPGAKPGDKSANGEKPGDKPANGEKSQPGDQSKQGSKQPGDKSGMPDADANKTGDKTGDKNAAGQPSSADKKNSNGENGENNEGKSDAAKPGDGAQAKQGSQPSDQKLDQPNSSSQPMPDAKGGDPQTPKGQSGAGQQDANKNGSASPQEKNQPNDHKNDSADGQSPKQSETGDNAKSPSNSPKESNSKGSEGGDKSGGGKEGPGQGTDKAGTGGAGKNTAADEGKGQSPEPGKGEDSSKGGADKQSDKPTGKPGDQSGSGSGASDKPANEGPPSSKPGDKSEGGGGDSGRGGNRTVPLPDGAAPDNSPVNGDPANMDFARKQFDLALDRLKKGNPDLLKELNWSADDAAKLAARLEQMKAAQNAPGPEGDRARQQMDDLLRNLGSRAGQLTRGGDRTANDAQRGVRESNDSGPPAEYQDLFDAFQQGSARGGR